MISSTDKIVVIDEIQKLPQLLDEIPIRIAIEIKAGDLVQEKHLKGLKALREEGKIKNFAVISNDPVERTVDNIHIYPWKIALDKLWKNAF